MALKKCKECGHDMSTSAQNCPNCGARNQMYVGPWTGCMMVIIGVLAFIIIAVILAFNK